MLQRVIGRMVRAEFGIEVTEDSNANGVAHASIVLEQASSAFGVSRQQLVA